MTYISTWGWSVARKASVSDKDVCLYSEYKHIHGRPKTNDYRNKIFNEALKEAEANEPSTAEHSTNKVLKEEEKLDTEHYCMDKNPKKTQGHMSGEHLEELERSLLENNLEDDENNLQMAAKIGAALLEENKLLTEENGKLKQQLASLEALIEEHEQKEENYISKLEHLQQKIADTELQVGKGRDQLANIQKIFEDHDKSQVALIEEFESKIKKQGNIIISLNRQLQKLDDNSKQFSQSETQTDSPQTTNIPSTLTLNPNSVQTELTQLKQRQDRMERTVEQLKTHLQPQTVDCGPNPRRLVDVKTSNNYVQISDNIKNCNQKVNDSREVAPNSTLYSVSLQVVKATQKTNTIQRTKLKPLNSEVQWTKKPPKNAIIKPKEDSYEAFFVKHIEYYRECMMKDHKHKGEKSDLSVLVDGTSPASPSVPRVTIQQTPPKAQDITPSHIETKSTANVNITGLKTSSNFLDIEQPKTAPP
ncbi:hypothetical protein J6590_007523 [Homalodisca vitripennis]|nr:hypothetical protein J6590_007523 [Homalodisca vitripennis]